MQRGHVKQNRGIAYYFVLLKDNNLLTKH